MILAIVGINQDLPWSKPHALAIAKLYQSIEEPMWDNTEISLSVLDLRPVKQNRIIVKNV